LAWGRLPGAPPWACAAQRKQNHERRTNPFVFDMFALCNNINHEKSGIKQRNGFVDVDNHHAKGVMGVSQKRHRMYIYKKIWKSLQ
ncbi:hypothetical protein, partial [Caldithrix abyssi]